MRYTPLGWAKKYEWTESDLRVACDMLDTWIDSVAMVSNLKSRLLSFNSSTSVLLLITFTNRLDPDLARQNVGPDLDPICLTLGWYS